MINSIYSTESSDTKIRFTVPGQAQPGDQTVMVTSTAGVQSEPHDVQIRSKKAKFPASKTRDRYDRVHESRCSADTSDAAMIHPRFR